MTGRPAPDGDRDTRRWALVPALCAPVALIGGWTWAARRQPPGYDAVRDTISALAAHGARDRQIMTTGLVVLGLCHLTTATGLRSGRLPGRAALAVGGAATLAVALFPQPRDGSSTAHTVSAGLAFVALSLWPALAGRRHGRGLLGRHQSVAATAALTGLLIWFTTELGGDQLGLSERVLAGAQSLWPLAVVLSTLPAGGLRR